MMCDGKKQCDCNCKNSETNYTLINDIAMCDSRRISDEGFLIANVKLARTGIQEYRGSELKDLAGLDPNMIYRVYRPASEVFNPESIKSFEGKPVTDNHPPELLNIDNVKKYQVGHVSKDVKKDANGLVTEIVITDKNVINKINNGKIELSNGYTSDHVLESGVTKDGEPYDIVQRNIRGNHVALVDRGRCGSECRVFDDNNKNEVNPMSNETQKNVKYYNADDGTMLPITDAAEPVVKDLQKKLDAMKKQLDEKNKELQGMKDKYKAREDESAEEKKKADEEMEKKKAEDEKEKEKEINDKIAVIDTAKGLIANYDWAGKSVSDIKRDVIAAKHSNAVLDAKSDDYINARYDIIKENMATEPAKTLDKAVSDAHVGAVTTASRRQQMIENNNNYWSK